MRLTTLLLMLTCSNLCMHCGSTTNSILTREQISLIKAWHVGYTSTRDLSSVPWGEASPASSQGQVERNFKFARLTAQILRTDYGIPVTDDTVGLCGHIRIMATEVPKGPPKYYDIEVYGSDGQLLVRKRVLNDARAMTETWSEGLEYQREINQRLAAYIGQQVADLLSAKPLRGAY